MDETLVSSMRRWRPVVAVLAGGLLLTACRAPAPDVTFYGNRDAVETGPNHLCVIDQAAETINCPDPDPAEVPRLTLGPGQAVQINVPSAIADTPWTVYFQYLDKDGTQSDGRTDTLRAGQLAYTLHPFEPTDQLTSVEVVNDFVLVAGTDGGVVFQPTRGWLLLVDPAERAAASTVDGANP
jgi:hypothetical protein